MLVFWDQRLVFLATPKAGSTAVATALEPLAAVSVQRPPQLKHTGASAYHRFVRPWLDAAAGPGFTTVALMREPMDWMASWYRFSRREDLLPHPDGETMSYEAFVRDWLARPGPVHADFATQGAHLAPGDAPPVDRIFRYDAMGGFIAFLEDRLGCEVILPHVNVSPPADLGLSAATEADLRRALAADSALYDRIG